MLFETLDGDDLAKITKGGDLDRPKPLETKLISPKDAGFKGEKDKKEKDDSKVGPEPEPEPTVA